MMDREKLIKTRDVVAHHLALRYQDGATLPHYNERGAVFFYGGPFSNFVGGPFTIAHRQPFCPSGVYERSYATIEHFFQASKAISQKEHDGIANCSHPGSAKAAGNAVRLRPDWDSLDEWGIPWFKYGLMIAGLEVKFRQDQYREVLEWTDDRYIAEDSPTDDVWGIRTSYGGFTGQNLLGLALMEVRHTLQEEGT